MGNDDLYRFMNPHWRMADEIGNDEEINRLVDPEWGPGAQGDAGDSNDAGPSRVAVVLRGDPDDALATPGQDGRYVGERVYVECPERLYGPFLWTDQGWLPSAWARTLPKPIGQEFIPAIDFPPDPPAQPTVVFGGEDEAASAVLAGLAAEVRALNQEKGWYDQSRSFGDEMVNLHAEVSEAWEAYRARGFEEWEGKGGKPEGVGSELADVFIRLLDDCASHGFDLYAEYRRKMAFNATRPYRHGGKLR